jgi:hypothetical protein
MGDADQIRFENKMILGELIKGLRLTQKEVKESKDGLDIKTLETGPMGGLLFRLISDWNRLRLLNFVGMSYVFNLYARMQMFSSSACGLVTAPDHQPANYIRGGEALEKIWLEITNQKLCVQPMTSLPIFAYNLQLNLGRYFEKAQRQKVQDLINEFFELFGIKENIGLIMLFRIGRANQPSVRALRRNMESFIKNND